jgi:hypothetical protein
LNHTEVEGRRSRAARNQSLFREVNERIEDLNESAFFSTFVCECLDESCSESVTMTLEEYEHVRADPNLFLVRPGHEASGIEQVREVTERYVLVSKLGAGAHVAAALDPRSRAVPD